MVELPGVTVLVLPSASTRCTPLTVPLASMVNSARSYGSMSSRVVALPAWMKLSVSDATAYSPAVPAGAKVVLSMVWPAMLVSVTVPSAPTLKVVVGPVCSVWVLVCVPCECVTDIAVTAPLAMVKP